MANIIVRSFDPVRAHSRNVDFSLKAFSMFTIFKRYFFWIYCFDRAGLRGSHGSLRFGIVQVPST